MKYIKPINEGLNWPKKMTWDFVKRHPELEEDHHTWIKELDSKLDLVKKSVEPKIYFDITDIRGFDKKKGPYAEVVINGDEFKFWTTETDKLWIENFVVDNTGILGFRDGFQGTVDEIIDIIIEEYR